MGGITIIVCRNCFFQVRCLMEARGVHEVIDSAIELLVGTTGLLIVYLSVTMEYRVLISARINEK